MYNIQLPSMTSMWHGSGVLNKRIFSSSTQTSQHAIQLYKLMHLTNPYLHSAMVNYESENKLNKKKPLVLLLISAIFEH